MNPVPKGRGFVYERLRRFDMALEVPAEINGRLGRERKLCDAMHERRCHRVEHLRGTRSPERSGEDRLLRLSTGQFSAFQRKDLCAYIQFQKNPDESE